MTILPVDPAAGGGPEALRRFLDGCQAVARSRGHAQLVSISVEVEGLDPLAVLESIFEPSERHFYVERPAEGAALAGAEAVTAFTAHGPNRFAACQAFIDETFEHAIAVGCVNVPFGGPHAFTTFAFEEELTIPAPFAAATVFVPRWQVATRAGRTVAVANLLVAEDTPLDALTQKVWRAHAKFQSFEFSEPEFSAEPAADGVSAGDDGGEVPIRKDRRGGPAVDSVSAVDDGPAAKRYRAAVAEALGAIGRDELHKLVLARTRELRARRAFHPLRVLNGLRQRFGDCYAFSVANGTGQSFIGASPERLLEVRGGRLRTEALAGSARRGAGASEDAAFASALARDEKELREHRVVVETIAAQLSALGLKPEFAARPGLRRFANVQHLHTAIEAPLAGGVRLLDAASRLHPTPAVGGWPRPAALARIGSLEGFPRGLYAGALGWVDSRGDGELFVGLRSALIDGQKATLYAGAGIVAGSDPDRELAETDLKFRAMQEALLA